MNAAVSLILGILAFFVARLSWRVWHLENCLSAAAGLKEGKIIDAG